MKPLPILLAALALAPLSAEPISRETFAAVLAIGDMAGVPRSVTRALMIEESGDRRTGALGDPLAISPPTKEGYRSLGLYQLYAKPANLAWLLVQFWDGGSFDIFNPIDNATVALRYLADLHRRFGSWYLALIYYNHGNTVGASAQTLAYARRIINAR